MYALGFESCEHERLQDHVNIFSLSGRGVALKPEPDDTVAGSYKIIEDGWVKYEDNEYYFHNTTLPMGEARRFCRQQGGDLAVITNEKEHMFLRNYALGLRASGMPCQCLPGWPPPPAGPTGQLPISGPTPSGHRPPGQGPVEWPASASLVTRPAASGPAASSRRPPSYLQLTVADSDRSGATMIGLRLMTIHLAECLACPSPPTTLSKKTYLEDVHQWKIEFSPYCLKEYS
ncbi:UNVERIFIED_CONTAM: hypothetical protein K2H54_029150 [Gekko kuhli]